MSNLTEEFFKTILESTDLGPVSCELGELESALSIPMPKLLPLFLRAMTSSKSFPSEVGDFRTKGVRSMIVLSRTDSPLIP